ncbi:MAG TPA: hypothetical protein ENL01_03835 [Chlorobaculum parvum]|uniref:Uncharacterized protein n=1 Tax=Chlorobaculum parvum TaxID=274539 RepID=A0A7C5DEQ5_9CHLB|nr:hypothetical protein [Chlorobaculum parvum]
MNGNLKPIGEGFFYCKSIKLAKSYETQRYEEYKPCFSGKVLLLACARPKYKETLKLLLAPLKLEMDTATDENKAFTKLSTGRLFDLALIDSKLQASASQGW